MEKILGLDLGTNSIGWAIREINPELENQIIDKGVITFEKGVAEDKTGEHPMVQKRTESRGKRRNYQAEKYRKWALLDCLIKNKMCPLSILELNEWRYFNKGTGRKYPSSPKFIQWLRFDFDGDGKPDFERLGFSKHESYYLFRDLIVNETKTEIFKAEPEIIGRVLYQIVQRRGYNDGQEIDETEKDELSRTIMNGGGDAGANGVNEILPFIEKYKTLGSALYHLQKEQGERIRKRYNLRSHFAQELQEICRIQKIEHLYKDFWAAIIWQRPLRSQKGLIGLCTFEQNRNRCPISHPLYEEFRTWVFINNLKIKPIEGKEVNSNGLKLLEVLHNIVYEQFFKAAPDFKLTSIIKALNKVGYEIGAKFPNDTKVTSLSFLHKMKEIFEKDWKIVTDWDNYLVNGKKTENVKYNIEDIWHIIFNKHDNKKAGKTSFDYLKQFVKQKLNLEESKAESFAKIRLQKGYATLSLSAIKKILPYLRRGIIYSEAIYLANLHKVLLIEKLDGETIDYFTSELKTLTQQHNYERKAIQAINGLIGDQLSQENRFGMDPSYQLDLDDLNDIENSILKAFGKQTWENIPEQFKESIRQYVKDQYLIFLRKKIHAKNVFVKTGRLHDKIFNWIQQAYNIPNDRKHLLWHPSEQETYRPAIEKNGNYYLGSPEPISKGFKNPMALKTLHRLKHLINYLIKEGKIDEDTRVVIEIARELNDANKRKAIEKQQREREKENEEFKKHIDEINEKCNTQFNRDDKNLLNKIRLWKEQKMQCLYTGRTIPLIEVLNGSRYNIEHTVPASLSFDNELKNLTLADRLYNMNIKKNQLPSECPNFEIEYSHEGNNYPPIMHTLESIFGKLKIIEQNVKGKKIKEKSFEKIETLEGLYAEWKGKTSEDKEIKDNIIIRRHLIKMELDYWKYKLNTFLITEYKPSWRNSQLRDTQVITKFALPYLKTVFNKVEVQKGSITSDFRKIYQIQPKLDKKDRTKHSHHAIDAATLTLIPAPLNRDKTLLKYYQSEENAVPFLHQKPEKWQSFVATHILSIEDEVLINFLPDNRTLTPTYKKARKRGKIQYVRELLTDGKWKYKLNQSGKRIPIIENGDSIRGQLHKQSFFGAIKNKNELTLVERYTIQSFTSIKDCKNIVDDGIRKIVQESLEKRMQEGMSFDKAKLDPIPFPNGKEVIKKVRCKVAAGRGYLTPEKSLAIHQHDFESKHPYKSFYYAQNEKNSHCLYYELEDNGKVLRAFRIVGLFEFSKLQFTNEKEFYSANDYNIIALGKGNNRKELKLFEILKSGTKVIFYNEHISELKDLEKKELLKRLYRIYKFNEMGTPNLFLQNHLEARPNEQLDDGDTLFDPNKYQYRLKIKADKFKAAIEGKHFLIMIDGEIIWKF